MNMSRGDGLLDARGVIIEPGDTAIYGFGVGRSVAMAEGRIRDDGYGHVSTTPSGRVWVTIVRRSYGSGTEDRVHIAPDRLVVLKPGFNNQEELDPDCPTLPESPLPTQDETNLKELQKLVGRTRVEVLRLAEGGNAPSWVRSTFYLGVLKEAGVDPKNEDQLRAWALAKERTWLVEHEAKLMALRARMGETA
jgi:hypothetical protein